MGEKLTDEELTEIRNARMQRYPAMVMSEGPRVRVVDLDRTLLLRLLDERAALTERVAELERERDQAQADATSMYFAATALGMLPSSPTLLGRLRSYVAIVAERNDNAAATRAGERGEEG